MLQTKRREKEGSDVKNEWEKRNVELLSDMKEWRENYKHGNPCKDFLQYGFCKHLIKTRTQKFRNRILGQLNSMIKGDEK